MATKRYVGEEAERVTLKDEQAAHMTIARLNAGQISIDDVMVPPPGTALSTLVWKPAPKRAAPINWSGRWSEVFAQLAPGYDPRHIEAFIRLEYSTLGHLSRATLRREVGIAKACIDEGGLESAEQCAKSFGL